MEQLTELDIFPDFLILLCEYVDYNTKYHHMIVNMHHIYTMNKIYLNACGQYMKWIIIICLWNQYNVLTSGNTL